MGLAEQRGNDGDHQQDEKPWDIERERRAEGDERDGILYSRQQEGEQSDTADGLTPGSLELVVEVGILELLEIERRGVAHEVDARAIGKEITQEALEQRRAPGQPFPGQCDRELDTEQLSEPHPVHGRPRAGESNGVHDLVHDQLADPQHRERNERARDPQEQDGDHIPRLAVPYQPQQSRHVPHRFQSFAPSGPWLGRLSAGGVGSYYRVPE